MKFIIIILVLALIGVIYYNSQQKKEDEWELEVSKWKFDNKMKKMHEDLEAFKDSLAFRKSIDSINFLIKEAYK